VESGKWVKIDSDGLLLAADGSEPWIRADSFFVDATHRRRYYPGAEYVDIASIDTYANPKLVWGACHEDARRRAYELMQQVAPGKMLATAEDSAMLNPDAAQKDGPPWLYCSAWWTGGKSNSPDWMRKTFQHEHMLTLDAPLLAEGNQEHETRPNGFHEIGKLPSPTSLPTHSKSPGKDAFAA
jgi:hypothetical protein